MAENKKLLSTNEIAHRLGVGADTVRKWLNTPDGMKAILVGNRYMVDEEEFNRFMKERQGRKKKT